jgi:ribonuclease E
MLDSEPTGSAAEQVAGDQGGAAAEAPAGPAEQQKPKKATRRRTAKATSAKAAKAGSGETAGEPAEGAHTARGDSATATAGEASPPASAAAEVPEAPAKKATRTRRRKAAPAAAGEAAPADASGGGTAGSAADPAPTSVTAATEAPAKAAVAPLFLAPDPPATHAAAATGGTEPAGADQPRTGRSGAGRSATTQGTTAKRRRTRRPAEADSTAGDGSEQAAEEPVAAAATRSGDAAPDADTDGEDSQTEAQRSRRRGRRGRGRGKGATPDQTAATEETADEVEPDVTDDEAGGDEAGSDAVKRRRRRRRRKGSADDEPADDDGVPTVVKVRDSRGNGDEVRGVTGSTRLEAKRQRRRGAGRDQRRTRPQVLSESEFLARREAVDRVMVIRQRDGRTQIGVLEDGVLVEHYVTRAAGSSIAGSVYLGKVQNVLPSMEAAFVDVGRGRNAVLYAGEVNWDVTGLEGKSRSIEQALKSGDSVMVQVTKDPVGNKGARLTSSIALSGRHLVYVPHGNASGISRKLPDNERRRLRAALKSLVPEGAGVIVRTAAEGASEVDLARDVKRLQAQWEEIQAKAGEVSAPALLYSEPDLVVRVVRDLFNEDFRELVIEGDSAFETVEAYLSQVSPDLVGRLRRHTDTTDVFAAHRIEEQILKGLDRKVYLPSGGHLVIDRTEAMTVIDVNTGKYTGTGGNLEETVTRNNLEAAEEIVRQLRLRDIGGIIVIDFIDMVLESNRELVLRRLTECLGRDRTKHQVTEITSLGLVQMTRKRVGAGLLEVFSETCECCKGRGVVVNLDPSSSQPKDRHAAAKVKAVASASTGGQRRRRGRGPGRAEETDDAAVPVEPVTEADGTGAEDVAADDAAGPASAEVERVGSQSAADRTDLAVAEQPPEGGQLSGTREVADVDLSEPDDERELSDEGYGMTGMFRRLRRGGGSRRTRP